MRTEDEEEADTGMTYFVDEGSGLKPSNTGVATRSWDRQGKRFFPESLPASTSRKEPCQHLDLSPVKPTSDFSPAEL